MEIKALTHPVASPYKRTQDADSIALFFVVLRASFSFKLHEALAWKWASSYVPDSRNVSWSLITYCRAFWPISNGRWAAWSHQRKDQSSSDGIAMAQLLQDTD